jgi:hypothetical protein
MSRKWITPEEWGLWTWSTLLAVGDRLEQDAVYAAVVKTLALGDEDEAKQPLWRRLLASLPLLLPCPQCRAECKAALAAEPVERGLLVRWMAERRRRVRAKSGADHGREAELKRRNEENAEGLREMARRRGQFVGLREMDALCMLVCMHWTLEGAEEDAAWWRWTRVLGALWPALVAGSDGAGAEALGEAGRAAARWTWLTSRTWFDVLGLEMLSVVVSVHSAEPSPTKPA